MEVRDNSKKQRTKPIDTLESFPLAEDQTKKMFNMNVDLTPDQKNTIIALICNHSSSFAWKSIDMPGISPGVITYKLNVLPTPTLIKQKKRVFGLEK